MGAPATARAACSHCGLTVPGDVAATEPRFCCPGCAAAWETLRSAGLEGYYGLREQFGGDALPVRPSGRSYAELDDPEILAATAPAGAEGGRRVELLLGGLSCAACVWLIERGLGRQPGVGSARVDLTRGTVALTWDPGRVQLSTLATWLDRVGYRPELMRDGAAEELRRREDRDLLLRLGVAGAMAGNIMLLAVPLYVGAWSGIAGAHAQLFRWLSLAFAVPVVFYSAMPFHRAAWRSLRSGLLHIDLPVSLGITIAFLGSTWATAMGQGEVFFDSLAGLVFFLLVGRVILLRGRRRAERAADALLRLGAPTARRVEGDALREVPAERLVPGDVVEVRPGESPPVDGTVVRGASLMDNRVLTGESRPTPVRAGDPVIAGATVLSGPLRIRAEAVGADRRLNRIADLARGAAATRAPVVRVADRLAGWFTGGTLVAAGGTLAVWLWLDPAHAVARAVAVAVVLCPCALGLATPLALAVAHGRAARRGMMVKGGDAVEALSGVRTVVLDKTGTLTVGEPRVVGWSGMVALEGRPLADAAAAVEQYSLHPVARALVAAGDARGLVPTEIEEAFGRGIAGTVAGHRVQVGTAAFCGGEVPPAWATEPPPVPGASRVFLGLDGRVVAAAWVADPIHPQAAEMVERLRAAGMEPVLLSGDAAPAVEATAAAVGIDRRYAGVEPEEKVRVVQALRRGGPVAMVGDGANDAAALAAADVGIAVAGSAEAALTAGDAYMVDGGVAGVADLVELAGRTMGTIRRNMAISVVYNLTGGTLAVLGIIGPLGAALLMPLSSLTVVLSSLALGRAKR